MAITLAGNRIVFVAEAFTADVTTAATVAIPAGQRLYVVSWNLTVTANTAVCPIQIKDTAGNLYAANRIPVVGAGENSETFFSEAGWTPVGLADGAELVIGGGGANGVLDGHVVYYVV